MSWILLSISIVYGQGTCPVLKEKELSSQRVYELTQNPACNIKSVGDLVSHLPKSFRQQYALFYRSRSVQGPVRTDYKRPRVILAGTGWDDQSRERFPRRFMLSFNSGDPDQPASDSAEMVDINTDGGREDLDVFKYRSLDFKEGKATLSHANPAKCKTCHGEPARPIYPGYPDWEGSYGALHVAHSTPEEIKGYEEFKESVATSESSRYRHLNEETAWTPETLKEDPHIALREANDRINGELGNANGVRVARLLLRTPEFDKFKFAIAGAFLRCEGMEKFVPEALARKLHGNIETRFGLKKALTQEKLDEISQGIYNHERHFLLSDHVFKNGTGGERHSPSRFKKTMKNAFGSSSSMERLYLDTFRVQGFSRADPLGANLRFVMEGRGQKIDNYFLDLMQPTYRFHNGGGAAETTVEEMAKYDRDLGSLIKGHYVPAMSGPGIDPKTAPKRLNTDKKLCDKLKAKSLAALKGYKLPNVDSTTEAAASCVDCLKGDKNPLKRQAEEIVATAEAAQRKHPFGLNCAACHDSEFSYAPPIPFSDEKKFREWLGRGENAALIRERLLHPDEEKRMPQNRRLTDEELNRLIRYISVER